LFSILLTVLTALPGFQIKSLSAPLIINQLFDVNFLPPILL
jgi:hypothetical protein